MHDQAIFFHHWYIDGKLNGIVVGHGYDFFSGGSTLFDLYLIKKIKEIFKTSHKDHNNFSDLGLHIKQTSDCIEVDQH